MATTHATIAAAGTSLILGTADPLALFLSLIGSQLPDLNPFSSMVGQIFSPISTCSDGKYFIVANEGDLFIMTDGKSGFCKAPEQILTERITERMQRRLEK